MLGEFELFLFFSVSRVLVGRQREREGEGGSGMKGDR